MNEFINLDMLLLNYATGMLGAAESFMVSALLTLNPEARRKVAAYDRLCGQMIHEIPPTPLSPHCLDAVLKRIDTLAAASQQPRGPRLPPGPEIPPQLQGLFHNYCGDDLLCWSLLDDGLQTMEVRVSPKQPERRLRLLYLEAHRSTTHCGDEMTLIIRGDYAGYHTGDLVSPDALRRRQTGPEGCLYLTLAEQEARARNHLEQLLKLLWNR